MATGPLRFRTPLIEELPTVHTKQAPGFAWVAVSGPAQDPSKNWGTTNRKRARNAGAGVQTDSQREALSARQQREVERKIRDLNSDGTRDVPIPVAKKQGGGGGGGGSARAGKTPNTKKILASGKTFAHYLDDEEAELARNGGRREGEVDGLALAPTPAAAASPANAAAPAANTTGAPSGRQGKMPPGRRKSTLQKEESASGAGAGVTATSTPSTVPLLLSVSSSLSAFPTEDTMDVDGDGLDNAAMPLPPLPSRAEMEALMMAPPLTYNQARSAPPPPGAPPPRRFCEICGYWGRVKCMKCGNMTCSVACTDVHNEHRCLKFYA